MNDKLKLIRGKKERECVCLLEEMNNNIILIKI